MPTKTLKTANQTPVHERKTKRAWNRDVVLFGIQLDNAGAISVNNEPLLEDSMPLCFEAQNTIESTNETIRRQINCCWKKTTS